MAWGPQSYGSPSPKKKTVSAPRSSGFDPSGFSYTTQPRDTSKPSFLSSMGGNDKPSGPNIVVKPKPFIPQSSQYSGVMAMSPRGAQEAIMAEYTRQKFFDGRPDITRDRLERRRLQEEEYNRFKQTQMKPVVGASNLYQSVTPGGPTLADEAMRLANIYGPTPSEIMGDIRYGAGKIMQGFAEKGTPLMNLIKDIYGGVQNFFTPAGGQGTTAQDPLAVLTPGQISSYNQLVALGMDPQVALAQVMQRYASGGIASLN